MKKVIVGLATIFLIGGVFFILKSKWSGVGASSTASTPSVLQAICGGQDAANILCYDAYYKKLVDDAGVQQAFADLRVRYETNAYIRSECHPLTHIIGQEASTRYTDVSAAFGAGDSFCWSGYYHGAMEGFVGRIGEKNLPAAMDGICANVSGKPSYSFNYYNCVHGLGHGVMEVSDDNLFDSLKLCDNLSGSWERQSCWSGVFMENVMVDSRGETSKYLKTSDPLYPCDAVDGQYKNTCYLMQSSYMLKVARYDFGKVFDWCRQAGSLYAATCFESIGRDASGSTISDSVKTKNICLLGKNFDEQSSCLIGAVKDFISYYHSDMQAKALCISMPTTFHAVCQSTVISYYASFK